MDRNYYSPIEMLKIAAQHAYCAQYLLNTRAEVTLDRHGHNDALIPILSLMYTAFVLMFKAYLLHDNRPVKQHKNLLELVELNLHIDLTPDDIELLRNLSRHQAFSKGIEYDLWEDREQQQNFCMEVLDFYMRLRDLMPLELQYDYLVG